MFGNNIRNLRTERKISLAKFSEITGISKGYLSKIVLEHAHFYKWVMNNTRLL